MSGRTNILHISDLHFTPPPNSNQALIVDSFISDLKNNVYPTQLRPDIVIFSGDICQSGSDNKSYEEVLQSVFLPILDTLNLDTDSLIICPGNHDGSQEFINDNISRYNDIINKTKSRESLIQMYDLGLANDYLKNVFEQYSIFSDVLSNQNIVKRTELWSSYYYRKYNIGIVSINTAWSSCCGLSGFSDFGNLTFPDAAIRDASRSLPSQSVKILVGHHPTNWLSEYCQSDFQTAANRDYFLHLFGHVHEPRPNFSIDPAGNMFICQAGAIYTSRNYYNGYSLISLATEDREIEFNFRSYFDRRQCFDIGTDVCLGGQFYASPEAKAYWSKPQRNVDRTKIHRWLELDVLPALQSNFNDGLGDRPVCEIFVPPPFQRDTFAELEEDTDQAAVTAHVTFEDLLSCTENIILYGPTQYGKTTVLQQLGIQSILVDGENRELTVPAFSAFSNIKAPLDRIVRSLRASIPDTAPTGLSFQQFLEMGLCTILIDDFNFRDRVRMDLLKSFIERFPRNRYILTADSNIYQEIGSFEIGSFPVPFSKMKIRELTRGKVRSLVEKWSGNNGIDNDRVIEKIYSNSRHINLPITGVNATIILTILEGEKDFIPINKAVLVERFIETLLEKNAVEEARRGRFDFRNKTHLLSHIAVYMAMKDEYILDEVEFYKVTEDYIESVGLSQDARRLIGEFKGAKILFEKDGGIGFRYRAFLEYFIAQAMTEKPEFLKYVLDERRYLQYTHEIEYYSGIKRSNLELIDLIGERFVALTNTIYSENEWRPDLKKLDKFKLPHPEGKSEFIAEVERQLDTPPLTDSERDELLQQDVPEDVENRQEVFRPNYKSDDQRWIGLLLLYSGILQNSELIPDSSKRWHLTKILTGWAIFMYSAFLFVPNLAANRKFELYGVEFRVIAPKGMSDAELARRLYLAFPRSVSTFILRFLGTEKLERQLAEPELGEELEPLVVQFFRTALYADLRLKRYENQLNQLMKKLQGTEFLFEALIWKMRFLLFDSPDFDNKALRRIIADATSQLKGSGSKNRKRLRGQVYQKMEKMKILENLRIKLKDRPF